MSEPTGSFGEYGRGPYYFDVHDVHDGDHQRNRYETRRARDAAAEEAHRKYPWAKIVRGADRGADLCPRQEE